MYRILVVEDEDDIQKILDELMLAENTELLKANTDLI